MPVLNDLFDYNLQIYQDELGFKFSLDSLLLAEFIEIKKSDTEILDLCSGNAPLPLILASRHNVHITGIEIQHHLHLLALKSIKYNNLEDKIDMLNINALDAPKYLSNKLFNIITCNPPFFKVDKKSLINISNQKALARHELTITLKEIIEVASRLLKDNGTFYLVHRPDRLEEIILLAARYHFHIKEMQFISSKTNDYAIMVLFKFTKKNKPGAKIGNKIINRDTKTYQNLFKRM